jgi:hypothetical protein
VVFIRLLKRLKKHPIQNCELLAKDCKRLNIPKNDAYQPVPHDAAFHQAMLDKPGVKEAYDALEEDYTALHALLAARFTSVINLLRLMYESE